MPLIDKSIIRRVERELYSYPQHLQANAERREELLYGTPTMDSERTCPTNKTGNPTMMRGVGLAELSEGWPGVISQALRQMPGEYQKLVKFWYFEDKSPLQVADKLHISRSLAFAWRENVLTFLVLLATQKGILKPIKEVANN